MLKNKKATVFWTLFLLVVLLMTVTYAILISTENVKGLREPVGKNSLIILDSIKQSEKIKLDLEQYLKISSYDSLKELGENGGYKEKQTKQFPLWTLENTPDLKESLNYILNNNLNSYTDSNYPGLKYELTIENNKIKITPTEPLQLKTDTPEINLVYYTNPKIEIDSPYSMNSLEEIELEAKKINNCIQNKNTPSYCLETSDLEGKKEIKFGKIEFEIPLTTNIYTLSPINIKFSIMT
jgi:hypothetical protein